MGASSVLIFNERTAAWRVQEPGLNAAGECAISTWAYAPRRRALVWIQSDADPDPNLYSYAKDDDLFYPIAGGRLQTYPLIPDGDAASLKRFHEIVFTISLLDDTAEDLIFNVSVGMSKVGATEALARALVANPLPPSVSEPGYYQLKHMVSRQAAIAPYLIVNLEPTSITKGRWRLHAIEVAWEPVSNRTYNRG